MYINMSDGKIYATTTGRHKVDVARIYTTIGHAKGRVTYQIKGVRLPKNFQLPELYVATVDWNLYEDMESLWRHAGLTDYEIDLYKMGLDPKA